MESFLGWVGYCEEELADRYHIKLQDNPHSRDRSDELVRSFADRAYHQSKSVLDRGDLVLRDIDALLCKIIAYADDA